MYLTQGIISRGQKQMLMLSRTITVLRDTIQTLNLDVDSQKREADRLTVALRDTQETLQHCIVTYRKELGAQRNILESQGAMLNKLVKSRVKIDLLVDTLAFVGCVIGLEYSLFSRLIVNWLVKFMPRKSRGYARIAVRFASLLAIFLQTRQVIIKAGMHSRCESFNLELEILVNILSWYHS